MIRLVAAAIMWKGVCYTGIGHGQIMQYMVRLGVLKDMAKDKVTNEMQGFVDEYGIFRER